VTAVDHAREALEAAVLELLEDFCSEQQVRAVMEEGGFDEKLWPRLLEMGVLELAAPTYRREAGASLEDLRVVFEGLGRFVSPVPALSTAVALMTLDGAVGEGLDQWAEDLVAGKRRVAVSIAVGEDLISPQAVVTAKPSGDRHALTGRIEGLPDAPGADGLLILARHQDDVGIFLVPVPAIGVTVEHAEPFDLARPVANVTLDGAIGVAVPCQAAGSVAAVLQMAWFLLACEQVGVAQRALDTAVSYAQLRKQFGRTIGSFQAIKHSCVDMLVQVEGSRELVRAAAEAMDGGDVEAARLHVSVAAAYAAEAAIDCAQRCLQIHGGIGFTWEHSAHLGLRKARADAALFAAPSAHWQAATVALATQAGAGLR
jgi:alkylation response protein AidB-like acyl-CoA dehydrogenase